jgi:ElaB/YqjD/DUF883 family membrane-anchored ribosome-binding protein
MNNDHDNDVDALREDIEVTRQRISGEIEAIGEKLTPAHAKDVARDKVADARDRAFGRVVDARDRAVGRVVHARDRAMERVGTSARSAADAARHAGERMPTIVRENPIPAAMLAVGATWLTIDVINRLRHRRSMRSGRVEHIGLGYGEGLEGYGGGYGTDIGTGERYEHTEGFGGTEGYGTEGYGTEGYGTEGYTGSASYGYGNENVEGGMRYEEEGFGAIDRTGEQPIRRKGEQLKERAGAARERIGEAAHSARERLRGTSHHLKERAGSYAQKGREYADKGRHGAIEVRDRSMDAYQHNPLIFGAVCVLTGVGLGMLLPHTRREDRALGERRQHFVRRARHVAEDAKEAAVHSAREGFQAAKETAREDFEQIKPQ